MAAVRTASGGGDMSTELPPARDTFDHFQPCITGDIRLAIVEWQPTSCTFDLLPTGMLKKFLTQLLPFITDLAYIMRC